MEERRSVVVHGVEHGENPIPSATRLGQWVFTSAISGRDPVSKTIPSDEVEQVRLAFENLQSVLSAVETSMVNVAKVTVWLKDMRLRTALNAEWRKYFPEISSSPVRHTMTANLPGNTAIQIEAIAMV